MVSLAHGNPSVISTNRCYAPSSEPTRATFSKTRVITEAMLTTLTLLLFASAPQHPNLAGDWRLVWDQMGTQYIRVTVTEQGPTAKVAWENESFECTLTGNVCEGFVTEN